tara:strand:+ start:3345 stop:4241 length:897 start_codon:yes stop_codon:yes gene_type:complete
MADSTIVVSDANDVDRSLRTDEDGSVHTPKHIVQSSALPDGGSTSALQGTINTSIGTGNTSLGTLAATAVGGQIQVDLVDLAGASTAALQGTANGILGTIDTDTGSINSKITACDTGAVVLAGGTAGIGALTAGTAAIGTVKLGAGTGAEIGKLAAGTASIGTVVLGAGSDAVGTVALGAGAASIGRLGTANDGVDIGDVDVASVAMPSTITTGTATWSSSVAVQLNASSTVLTSGVLVKALAGNAAVLYVGASNVAVSSTNMGIELSAKESVFIEIDNLNKVYIIAAATGSVTYLAS